MDRNSVTFCICEDRVPEHCSENLAEHLIRDRHYNRFAGCFTEQH